MAGGCVDGRALVGTPTLTALAVVLLLLTLAGRTDAMCCICEGYAGSNVCAGAGSIRDCTACAASCAQFNATVRTCCDGVPDCSGGVAGTCTVQQDVCLQIATGPGYCDGTCSNPPTATATATVTATASATPTVTSTATVTPTAISTATATPQPDGADCTDTAQCASTFCVDGVCCDQACDGPQEQCNLAGQRGTCAGVPAAAPALSPQAILLALSILGGLAVVALRRRTS